MDFSVLLEKKGIPEYLYKAITQSAEQDIQNALSVIARVCQAFPVNDPNPPILGEFFIALTCKSFQSLTEVAQQTWGLLYTLKKHMQNNKECLAFFNFLNEIWTHEVFLFYLKCRKSIIQTKIGESCKIDPNLGVLRLSQPEWVSIVIRLFSGVAKPTSCVQKISQKVIELDYVDTVPGNVLLVLFVEEFLSVTSANLHKKPAESNAKKPTPPPRSGKIDFDLMKLGKFVSKKPETRENSFIIDEELHSATIKESPQSNEKPVFYKIPMNYDNQSEEISSCQQELQAATIDKDKLKEALEEAVEFCDGISYEHDMLLIQNSKLKKLLSIVTDKLIRIDQDSINDIDFSDVLDDPCMEFKPTGELKKNKNRKFEKNRHNLLNLPFSETAGKDIQKKQPPITPKFQAVNQNDFEDGVFTCCEDHLPSQSGLLNMKKGEKIKKISELDDWFFGENLQTMTRGFFPPSSIR